MVGDGCCASAYIGCFWGVPGFGFIREIAVRLGVIFGRKARAACLFRLGLVVSFCG